MRLFLVAALAASVLLAIPAQVGASNPTLFGTVGPGFTISLTDTSALTAGTYDIDVTDDNNSIHNFHLCKVVNSGDNCGSAGAVDVNKTTFAFQGHVVWADVSLTAGIYVFQCDNHFNTGMKGNFTVAAGGGDSTPPVLSVDVTPTPNAGGWNNTNVTVDWTVDEPESPGSLVITGCADQSFVNETLGSDASCQAESDGGTSQQTLIVKIDKTLPDTSLTGHPDQVSTSTTALFSLDDGNDPNTYLCRLDGGPEQPCTSPTQYMKLAKRSHHFEARAVDQAGNVDDTPATWDWTNGAVPKVKFTSKFKVTDATADVAFGSSDPGATYTCQLDQDSTYPCTSPEHLMGLGEGPPHVFTVFGTDAGGRDGAPASFTWTVDTTAPDTDIAQGPPDPSTSTSAKFKFTSTEKKSTFECNLDSAGFVKCPKGYTGLGVGSHTIDVRAIDAVGNVDASPDTYSWEIDLA